jgi:hypothetical protein
VLGRNPAFFEAVGGASAAFARRLGGGNLLTESPDIKKAQDNFKPMFDFASGQFEAVNKQAGGKSAAQSITTFFARKDTQGLSVPRISQIEELHEDSADSTTAGGPAAAGAGAGAGAGAATGAGAKRAADTSPSNSSIADTAKRSRTSTQK